VHGSATDCRTPVGPSGGSGRRATVFGVLGRHTGAAATRPRANAQVGVCCVCGTGAQSRGAWWSGGDLGWGEAVSAEERAASET